MDGLGRGWKWRAIKERLELKAFTRGCCGSSCKFWPLSTCSARVVRDSGTRSDVIAQRRNSHSSLEEEDLDLGLLGRTTSARMNLAAALAAERRHMAAQRSPREEFLNGTPGSWDYVGRPWRVSLLRLFEETHVEGRPRRESESEWDCDSGCCVCMARKKGSALIPCGHTFCRVCSRELLLNRGDCPLCNNPIVEILDIF